VKLSADKVLFLKIYTLVVKNNIAKLMCFIKNNTE